MVASKVNHQTSGSPVDHFYIPLDIFKGLDELENRKGTHMSFLTRSLSPSSLSLIS
jgi:hypothetical protein